MPVPVKDPEAPAYTPGRRTLMPAPKGIVLSDLDWVGRVAQQYRMESLDLAAGSIVLERIEYAGGRCFCYPDGSWLIGLSLPRFQRCGRSGMEGILAHELLHAWLWTRDGYTGHGPVFLDHASVRGIPRWCSPTHDAPGQDSRQLLLFDI